MTRLDTLAGQLGRARQAHERRPHDLRLENLFNEARAELLAAQLKASEEVARAQAGEIAAMRATIRALKVAARQQLVRVLEGVRPARRARKRRHEVGAPLFERARA